MLCNVEIVSVFPKKYVLDTFNLLLLLFIFFAIIVFAKIQFFQAEVSPLSPGKAYSYRI